MPLIRPNKRYFGLSSDPVRPDDKPCVSWCMLITDHSLNPLFWGKKSLELRLFEIIL